MKLYSPAGSAGRLPPKSFVLAMLLAGGMSVAATGASADPVNDGRSTPGTVVPSTGTTGGAKALAPTQAAQPKPNAGSLSGPGPAGGRCAALRKRYAQSQACFERFRLQNGGLRPGASKSCKQIKNPSLQCGSEIVG